ncbi:DUF2336 domain-containing protein [Rhizobium leguminosarum bv. viciae]|nr:DUF2336 domain-containing protein [Rhizobium binae]MBX4928204.1 DUF2336 domain-containing protein [Rhizobium binae]MBX4970840.1 DUF2336 domain-containing protein [Rhizobium binae]MBX4993623.1 DUF2336 domain-containing protein [Rhizobium binae]NKL46674.1 DUF2336 domain-containing protein [Rhizobium leguminosarum bv. viciae]
MVLRFQGVHVRDRFRDLEGPLAVRKKDVVLMATVSSFESLSHPTRSELRQFAELFTPLFQASSDEAKRQAVAALSQCQTMPAAVALFIGNQPIEIAAPFLAASKAIADDTLITIARMQGAAHVKAIVSRDSLSPKVIDALVALRQTQPRSAPPAAPITESEAVPLSPTRAESNEAEALAQQRLANEEALRERILDLAGHLGRKDDDRLGLRTLTDIQEALLVRFARSREATHFATALADTLSASRWLAERIMLDLSGQQLATTLTSLGMGFLDSVFVLERFYPHLGEQQHHVTRAWMVLDALDPEECHERVEAWRRADRYTYNPEAAVTPALEETESHRFVRQAPVQRDMRMLGRRSR